MILVDLWTLKVLHLCWNSHNTVFLFPNYNGLCWPFSACKLPNMAASPGAKDPVIKCEKQRYQGIFRELFFKHTRGKNGSKTFSLLFPKAALQTYVVEGGWWYFLLVCGCPPCHVTTFHICYEGGTN